MIDQFARITDHSSKMMKPTPVKDLLEKYDVFLLDAYGVLVTSTTTLPGSAELLAEIEKRGKEYWILTNDASRTPATVEAFLKTRGLDVPVEKIFTAGVAIEPAISALKSPRCLVLGTDDTKSHVLKAGGKILPLGPTDQCNAIVIGDDSGFDVLPALNVILTTLHRLAIRGEAPPKLLLANADLIYPRGNEEYNFTSGSLARLIEIGFAQLHPELNWTFEILGKPSTSFFQMPLAQSKFKSPKAVMIGDQLRTDILGAHNAGIDSALALTGLTRLPLPKDLDPRQRPTYVLESLVL